MAPLLCTSDESTRKSLLAGIERKTSHAQSYWRRTFSPFALPTWMRARGLPRGPPTFTGHERRVRHVCGSPVPITACPGPGLGVAGRNPAAGWLAVCLRPPMRSAA